MEISKIGCYVCFSDDKITEVSSSFSMLTGYTIIDLSNKNITYLLKLLKIKKELDYYYIFTKNEEPIKIMITTSQDICSFTKLDDNKLQSTYKQLEKFHFNRGFAMYSYPNFLLLKCNNIYSEFINKNLEINDNPLGKTLEELLPADLQKDHCALFTEVSNAKKEVYESSHKLITSTNSELYLDISLIPIFKNDTLVYIIESFYDNTDYINQKNQKEFFMFVCHELKTPLTVIVSALQTMKLICKDELTLNSNKYLSKIHQSSLQQWRLITHLLDILKTDKSYLTLNNVNADIVSLTQKISDVVSDIAQLKGVNLKFSSSINHLIIGIDEEKYERVLLNLLSNAIKYTPKGNSIYIKISRYKKMVQIEVQDTGIGIPKQKLNTIFNLYTRINNSVTYENEGSGIGLYLVKELLTAMDGEIQVISKQKKGTCFKIFLPTTKVNSTNLKSSFIEKEKDLLEKANIEFSSIPLD